jgi:hypothetical protein
VPVTVTMTVTGVREDSEEKRRSSVVAVFSRFNVVVNPALVTCEKLDSGQAEAYVPSPDCPNTPGEEAGWEWGDASRCRTSGTQRQGLGGESERDALEVGAQTALGLNEFD